MYLTKKYKEMYAICTIRYCHQLSVTWTGVRKIYLGLRISNCKSFYVQCIAQLTPPFNLHTGMSYIKVYTGVKLEWVVLFSVRLHDLIVNLQL